MPRLNEEINRRRTFAIISHPDAGKTTLTEKLLLYGGAIQLAGSVKGKATARHAVSDWMELEKQRNTVVERMKALPETEVYRKTEECQQLVAQIKPLDMQIIYKARAWLNKSRQQNASVHAYDLQNIGGVGSLLNKKY